ncbi:hypothetical protein [Micromonospora siamensis]|uniref:hypothetical protein n=1 Tax=Micromonospora siamensis TaxID=299152 RepID=UPI0018D54275|nr:hypothetical protein [Micromonospora siamensis]
MPLSRTFGSITVTALTDAEGPFFQPCAEAFRDATEAQWREADRRDPAAVTADGEWWLPFRAFAPRTGDGPATLVDVGPPASSGCSTATPTSPPGYAP